MIDIQQGKSKDRVDVDHDEAKSIYIKKPQDFIPITYQHGGTAIRYRMVHVESYYVVLLYGTSGQQGKGEGLMFDIYAGIVQQVSATGMGPFPLLFMLAL